MGPLTKEQQASIRCRTPFLFSADGEAYLPCSAPPTASPLLHSLRLTAPRPEDVNILVETLNDPSVYPQMRSIPYPLELQEAAARIEVARQLCDEALLHWTASVDKVEGCPFNVIRAEVDGREVWVGGIGIRPWPFDELEGPEKDQKVAEMMRKEVGDPTILRTLGFYLHPAYQGHGIMTIVLRTLLDRYLVPLCGAKLLRSTVYNGNFASRRVFEKAGFVCHRTNWVNEGASRGGRMKEEWWMEWDAASIKLSSTASEQE